jgi:hypothetical protein
LYVHEVYVEDAIKKGNTLQTAASKPHGGIALYRDILANVLDISASKGTENFETDKENERKFNKGERFLLASGAESNANLNPNGNEVVDVNDARPLESVQEVVAKAEEEAKELKEILQDDKKVIWRRPKKEM